MEGVTCGLGQKMETKSSSFWSGNFIPSRRKDERRLLGLRDKGGYASLSSLGEVQVLVKRAQSKQGICMRGYVYQCVFMARTPQWPLLA